MRRGDSSNAMDPLEQGQLSKRLGQRCHPGASNRISGEAQMLKRGRAAAQRLGQSRGTSITDAVEIQVERLERKHRPAQPSCQQPHPHIVQPTAPKIEPHERWQLPVGEELAQLTANLAMGGADREQSVCQAQLTAGAQVRAERCRQRRLDVIAVHRIARI